MPPEHVLSSVLCVSINLLQLKFALGLFWEDLFWLDLLIDKCLKSEILCLKQIESLANLWIFYTHVEENVIKFLGKIKWINRFEKERCAEIARFQQFIRIYYIVKEEQKF